MKKFLSEVMMFFFYKDIFQKYENFFHVLYRDLVWVSACSNDVVLCIFHFTYVFIYLYKPSR